MDNTGDMQKMQGIVDSLRIPIFAMGLLLILGGGVMLYYLAMLGIQVVQNPSEVGLVQWLTSGVAGTDLVIDGQIGREAFEIRANSVVQHISLAIVGLILISILVSVINAFIAGGIKLVMFAATALPTSAGGKSSRADTMHGRRMDGHNRLS